MFGRIYAVALNTFREAVRKRFLYAVLVVVVGLNLFVPVFAEMSLHEEARFTRDAGLGVISAAGNVTAIILGVLLLYTEIQRRTIHTILSKPLERHEFVLGKYLGMAMTLTLLVVLFTLAMFALLAMQDVAFTSAMVKAVVLSYVEILLVAGIAVFFSSFSSPILSGVFGFFLWRLGHCTPAMKTAMASTDADWIRDTTGAALYVVPDLHLFAVSGTRLEGQEYVSVHGDFVSWGYVGTTVGYGLLYLAVLLVLAVVIFSRRDFA